MTVHCALGWVRKGEQSEGEPLFLQALPYSPPASPLLLALTVPRISTSPRNLSTGFHNPWATAGDYWPGLHAFQSESLWLSFTHLDSPWLSTYI